MCQTVKDQITERVDRLEDSQRRLSLGSARRPALAGGVPDRDVLRFAGPVDRAGLEAMSQLMPQGCEKVKPHGC